MKNIVKYCLISLLIFIVIFFIGFFIYSNQYERNHPSPYPDCKRMIKVDSVGAIVDGQYGRKQIKSIVYLCKDGKIIETNESIK